MYFLLVYLALFSHPKLNAVKLHLATQTTYSHHMQYNLFESCLIGEIHTKYCILLLQE